LEYLGCEGLTDELKILNEFAGQCAFEKMDNVICLCMKVKAIEIRQTKLVTKYKEIAIMETLEVKEDASKVDEKKRSRVLYAPAGRKVRL